jgi:hypothetical protein
MQQIQQQLQRIGTLVGIKQFDSARMQLREGPTSGLRRTLRETENDFVGVSDSVSRFQHSVRHSWAACRPTLLVCYADDDSGTISFLPQHAGFP